MTTLYKLTDADGRTRGPMQWGENVTHIATGDGTQLCSDGFIHAYESPRVAVLLNPIHASYMPAGKLWEAEGEIALRDGQAKCGCKSLTTLRQIDVPQYTTMQRVYFGILCALEVYRDERFVSWARAWIDGDDRTANAAKAAADASDYAANAAAEASDYAANAAAANASADYAAADYAAAYAAYAAKAASISLDALAIKAQRWTP